MRLAALAAWSLAGMLGQSPEPVVHQLTIAGFRFAPANLTVSVGDRLVWTNTDAFLHTTTADSGAWRSGELKKGARFIWVTARAGRYQYHCSAHPTMLGVVIVR